MQGIDKWLENFLLEPEENAAGRIGLYRIGWVLIVLFNFLILRLEDTDIFFPVLWEPVGIMQIWSSVPSPTLTLTIGAIYITSLFFILFGFKTRWATAINVVAAIYLYGLRYSFGKIDHGHLLVIYMPAFMLFCNWGVTYSVDALLKKRRGEPTVDPQDGSWRYSWSIKLMLVALSVLFCSSGIAKMVAVYWVIQPDYLYILIANTQVRLDSAIWDALLQLPIIIFFIAQLGVIAFETLYPLALRNKTWRTFFLSMTILFHFGNYTALGVGFIHQFFVYALFIDWHSLYRRFVPAHFTASFGRFIERYYAPLLFVSCVGTLSWWWFGERDVFNYLRLSANPPLVYFIALLIALWGLWRSMGAMLRTILQSEEQATVSRGNL